MMIWALPGAIAREEGKDLTTMALPDNVLFEADAYACRRDCMMAIHFLYSTDHETDGGLLKDLHHNYLMNKKTKYPKNLQAAYVLLKGWNKGKAPSGCSINQSW